MAALVFLGLGAWAAAQVFATRPVFPPVVFSGNELGFQVTAYNRDTPLGTFVVRIDGKWVPVKEAASAPRISSR
jgi:hypothetical protein